VDNMVQEHSQRVLPLTAKYSSSFFISFVTLTSDELPSSDTVNRLRASMALSPAWVWPTYYISLSERGCRDQSGHQLQQGVPRT